MGIFDLFRAKAPEAPQSLPVGPVSAYGRRFAVDRARMFDLEATQRLAGLFTVPDGERDPAWIQAFFDTTWNASVTIPDPPHFDGPDGLPYYRLNLPRAGEEFDSQSLSNLAGTCVELNAGAAFYSGPDDPETSSQYVIPMGTLDSLLRYDSPDGDPIDRAEAADGAALRSVLIGEGEEMLIATPSPDFLPAYGARALHRYMTRVWNIAEPRVQLMVNGTLRPTRNLVIGRKRSEFATEAEVERELRMLFWFLPPQRGIVLMPEDWAPSDMTRLTDLFE